MRSGIDSTRGRSIRPRRFTGNAPPPKVDLWGREIERHSFGSPGTDFLYRMTVPVRIQETDRTTQLDRLILNWNNGTPMSSSRPVHLCR